MAKTPTKKKAAVKAAPSDSKKMTRRNGVVTIGKNSKLGKGVK